MVRKTEIVGKSERGTSKDKISTFLDLFFIFPQTLYSAFLSIGLFIFRLLFLDFLNIGPIVIESIILPLGDSQ